MLNNLIYSISKKYIVVVFLIIFGFFAPTSSAQNLDSLLVELESVMSKRSVYDNEKETRINNLKELLADKNNTNKNNYYLINKIIDEYAYYSFDSTLCYINKNLKIGQELKNDHFINETRLKLSSLLISTGRYKEAVDLIGSIKKENLSDELINNFYENNMEVYSRLSFYTPISENKKAYQELYEIYKDSLLSRIDKDSESYLAIIEKELRDERRLGEALVINSKRAEMVPNDSRAYAIIAFERALLYLIKGDVENEKMNLIKSAMADIHESIKDNASLTLLSTILFKENDIERAHKYINFSFEDAEFYNSQFRFVNISNILPVISKAYEKNSMEQKSKLKTMLIFISLLAIILLASLFYIYSQVKKLAYARNKLKIVNKDLKKLNAKLSVSNNDLNRLYNELSEANRIKEHYIGSFLNLYSDYIDKLDIYRKMVRKYISTNKFSTLLDLTKSKQVIDTEMEVFFKNFDESFLHIYPTFIDQVNNLMQDEYLFGVKNEDRLNTELRILALIRLGISSSSQIAKILRYSVNTIYNYRVKIRNCATNRELFEDMIKKIQ
ncbi:DUF6377 domain-containing protein [Abyssalbus ytuae]|uniref:DUF6377 domain-containing protein n=1 Tax=Abyssalbus ytuae TaxID=2926907 RepID=A0A9E7D2F4_9FLAO|nr:DUF6377 domain-containing protein [Abyssalbus ytuae]UOB16629.1 DUF6377 domain-containing protein [Abyssalbus ytuae]